MLRVSALTRLLLILSASEDREESLIYRERWRGGTVVRGGGKIEVERGGQEGGRERDRVQRNECYGDRSVTALCGVGG